MKHYLKTTATYFVTVLMLPFFVIGLLLGAYTIVNGQLPPGAIGVFGGRIGEVIQCTCSGGHVISVGGPRPGRFRFTGASQLYAYGQIKSIGAWVLGNYSPPTPCLVVVCPCGPFGSCCCAGVAHQGNIQIVGTSLTGGSPPSDAPALSIVLPPWAFTKPIIKDGSDKI